MTKNEILEFIKELPSAAAVTPWEGDFYSTVLKHGLCHWVKIQLGFISSI